MEGNHHRFPAFLDGVVVLFSMMTIVSSVLGYLRYGHQTEQILLQNLPQNSTLVLVIDIALIIAILCTYPLQVYPVIEIMEGFLFAEGVSDNIIYCIYDALIKWGALGSQVG